MMTKSILCSARSLSSRAMSSILFRRDDGFSQFSHVRLEFIQLTNPLFGSQSQVNNSQRQIDAEVSRARRGRARLRFDQPSLGIGIFDLVHTPESNRICKLR